MKNFYKPIFYLFIFFLSVPAQAQVTAGYSFAFNNGSQCVPAIVNFTNTSTGNPAPLTYVWTFQDGSPATSTLQDPTVLFTPCGNKTVTLVTTNASGATNTYTTTVFIACLPTPAFSVSPSSGCPPLNAVFTNLSIANSGTMSSYTWDFCDGVLSNIGNPSHIFSAQGCYCTKLIAVNSFGCQEDTTVFNSVCVTQAPVANVTTFNAPSNCTSPYTVNFSGLTSTPAAGLTYAWQFLGAGVSPTTSTSPTPSVTYNNSGSFTVKLTVTLPNGCSNTITLNNYVNIAVNIANYTASALTICSGSSIAFVGSPANFYNWTVTPAAGVTPAPPQSIQNPVFTFANPGNYNVCLTLTFNGGCTAVKCTTIVVNPKPNAIFSIAGNLTTCMPPVPVTITNTSSSGAGITYNWSFPGGNPTSSILQNPLPVNYTACGDYNMSLIVSNTQGCTDTFSIPSAVTIDCPVANFTWNIPPGQACAPFTVPFNSMSTGNPNSWQWNFDYDITPNNWVAGSANPTHTYNLPGCHTVGLIIQNAQGCKDTLIINNAICLGIEMTICFSASDTDICAIDPVIFTNCSTPAPPYPPGVNVSYLWNFGDGGTSTVMSPTYTYTDTGDFAVQLICTYNGCSDTLLWPDHITVNPPIAKLFGYYDCDHYDQCTLSAHQSIGGDTYTWTIPGALSVNYITPDSVLVTWPMPSPNSSYACFVHICNTASGCCQDKEFDVFLRNMQPSFYFDDSVGCIPFTSTIYNTSIGASSFQWRIFDALGNIVTTSLQDYLSNNAGPTGSYTWTVPGTYTIRMVAFSVNGCRDTLYQSIEAYGLIPSFNSTDSTGCPPLTVSFTNTTVANSISNPVSYEWNFGDTGNPNAVQSTLPSPTHTYTTVDTFDVRLIVTDNHGCKDTLLKPGFIKISMPTADFIAPDTSGCIGEQICFFDFSTGGSNLSYSWNFGDPASGVNNTSTLANPCHSFATIGLKTIRLIITDPNGCSDTLIKTNYISIGVLTGSFTANATSTNCPPLIVSFNNTTAGIGAGSTFWWDFGDGVTSVVQNPQHIYSTAGDYTVTLIVQNSFGCIDTVVHVNYIHLGGASAIVAASATMGCAPFNVCFTVVSSNSQNFLWNLGDTASFILNASPVCHTYQTPGIYRAEVYLTDSTNCTYPFFIDSIYVVQDTAFFTLTPDEICTGGMVQFQDSSHALTPFTLLWDFGMAGNNDTSTLSAPTFIYNSPGTYIITLVSTAVPGCSDTWVDSVLVTPAPIADFSFITTSLCQAASAQFTDATNSLSTITNYSWDFGDATSGALNFSTLQNPTHNYSTPNVYIVTLHVIANNGCSDSITHIITINPAPIAVATNDTSTCLGNSVQLSGGGAINYSWTPGATLSSSTISNPIATPLTTTTFTLTITNNLGCQDTETVVINVLPLPNVNAGSDAAICENDSTQLVGSGAVNYLWSPAFSLDNNSINNPNAFPIITTTYTLTASDVNGCANVDSVIVSVLAAPIADAGLDTLICISTSGILHANGTGNYVWTSIPAGFNSVLQNPIINPVINTTYVLQVTNAGGCSDNDSVFVIVAAPPISDAGNDTAICIGTSAQLSGSGGILYSWSPSIGLSATNIQNPIASPIVTTTYFLTAGDGTCFSSTDSMVVSINPLPLATVNSPSPNCPGSSNQLAATGGLNYLWSPSVSLSADSIFNPIASPTITTTYSVVVTDLNGCSDDTTLILIVTPGPVANAGNDTSVCDGTNAQLSASGGTGYSWIPDATLSSTTISNPIATPLSTTTYFVIVSDATSCIDTDEVVVTVIPLPVADAGTDSSVCFGFAVQLNASVGSNYVWSPSTGLSSTSIINPVANPLVTTTYYLSVNDGICFSNIDSVVITVNPLPLANVNAVPPICPGNSTGILATGGLNYVWSPAASLSSSIISNPVASPNSTTLYNVTVTDVNGCTDDTTLNLVVLPGPVANAGNDIAICIGNNATLNGSGGVGYSWSPSTALSSSTISNPNANPVVNTTYVLTVSDATSCLDSDTIIVTVNLLPLANAGNDTSICTNDSAQLHATGGVNYSWSPGATLSVTNIYNPIASPLSTSTYTVDVTDLNSCVASDSVVVTVFTNPNASAGPDTSVCNEDTIQLNGSGGISFSWLPAINILNSNSASPLVFPDVTTTYTVTVTDANGCTTSDDVQVVWLPPPPAFAGNDTDVCLFDTVQLNASGGINYLWSPTTGLNNNLVSNPLASPPASQTYSVLVTDALGCTATDDLFLLVNQLPPANAGPDVTMCSNTAIILNGSGGIIFSWSPGISLSDSTISNPIALPDSPLYYILTVIDTNECVNTDSLHVNILYPFNAVVSNDTCICLNDEAQLSAAVANTLPYYYVWTPVESLSNAGIKNPVASPTIATTYTVIVFDGQCYADTDDVEICVWELPEIFAGYDQQIMVGTSIQLQASTLDHGTYDWTPDSTLSCDNCLYPYANPVMQTNYIIIITDEHTCKDEDTVMIDVTCLDQSLFIPNAFTPNNDGLNDQFVLDGRGISSLTYLRIFNRWGEMIYETNDLNIGWNGTYRGMSLTADVFVYYLEAICETGQTIRRQGNITLIR